MTKALSFSTSLFFTFFLWFVSFHVSANPQDGNVVSGNISIQQESPTKLGITQTTDKGIINWQKFNIDANEHTQFYQPSQTAVTLNRVVTDEPSKILGQLSANGRIFIINQNGILFGADSKIDVAGLVASVNDIHDKDFLNGKFNFSIPGHPNASVINQGYINITDQGIAAFVAPSVQNSGTVVAKLGKVSLAAANGFTLDLYGDELITLLVDEKVAKTAFGLDGKQLESFVDNSGNIEASGGYVVLTAQVARDAVNAVINQSGIIETQSIAQKDGKIVLNGGDSGIVQVTGSLNAGSSETKGGYIEVTGEKVGLFSGANLDASGKTGGGTILVGGDYLGGKATDETYKRLGIQKENKAIQTAQAVAVDKDAVIKADALESGTGGKIVVWSDGTTRAHGKISSTGVDKGGFVETSGDKSLNVADISVDVSSKNKDGGAWLLDPTSDVNIEENGTDTVILSNDISKTFSPNASNSLITANTISSVLNSGADVTILTTNDNSSGRGQININADIDKTFGGDASLNLFANSGVHVDFGKQILSTSGKLHVNIDADTDNEQGGFVQIKSDSLGDYAIQTNGGDVNIRSWDTVIQAKGIKTKGGNVFINPIDAGSTWITIGGDTNGNSYTIDSGTGNVTINSRYLDTGGDFVELHDYALRSAGVLTLDSNDLRNKGNGVNYSNSHYIYDLPSFDDDDNNIEEVAYGSLVLKNNTSIDNLDKRIVLIDEKKQLTNLELFNATNYFQRTDFSFLRSFSSFNFFTPVQQINPYDYGLAQNIVVLPDALSTSRLVASSNIYFGLDPHTGTTDPTVKTDLNSNNSKYKYTIDDAYKEKGFIPDFATPETLAKKLDLFGTTDLAKLELDPRWTAYPKDFREKAYRIASPTSIRAVTPEDTAIWSKNKKFLDVIKDGVIDANERVDLILSSDASESDKNAMLISYGLQELGNVYIGSLGKASTVKPPYSNTTGISKIIPKVESKVDKTTNIPKISSPAKVNTNGFRSEFYDNLGNPKQWRNPLTNKIENIPEGVKIEQDHIFPVNEIKKLTGYKDLTGKQQIELLNDKANLQPLPKTFNCSKGAKCLSIDIGEGSWKTYKKEELDYNYQLWLNTQQNEISEHLRDRIQEMLSK